MLAIDRPHDHPLEGQADRSGNCHRGQHRDEDSAQIEQRRRTGGPVGHAGEDAGRDIGAECDEHAMAEIEHIHQAENQCQPRRDDEDDHAHRQPGNRQRDPTGRRADQRKSDCRQCEDQQQRCPIEIRARHGSSGRRRRSVERRHRRGSRGRVRVEAHWQILIRRCARSASPAPSLADGRFRPVANVCIGSSALDGLSESAAALCPVCVHVPRGRITASARFGTRTRPSSFTSRPQGTPPHRSGHDRGCRRRRRTPVLRGSGRWGAG